MDADATISIHAPREGGDGALFFHLSTSSGFQSTPPARGATFTGFDFVRRRSNFNPRPPRGGRRHGRYPMEYGFFISIHAPREGGDCKFFNVPYVSRDFNPRPPRGGRLVKIEPEKRIVGFQSTPPARGATVSLQQVVYCAEFQSTPPARGATRGDHPEVVDTIFQSTPPARGATLGRTASRKPL